MISGLSWIGKPARNWSAATRDIALSALAAMMAWTIASHAFGNDSPVFAAIAAIVCLAPGIGSHGRQAVGMIVGVAVGIAIGEAAKTLPLDPSLRIGAVTLLAMFAAAGFGLNAVMVIQAGASAVLVVGSGTTGAGATRIADSLVGGACGLLFSQVFFTPDPLPRLRRVGATLVVQVEAALGTGVDVDQALSRIRQADAALEAAIASTIGIARWTVRGRLDAGAIAAAVESWHRPLGTLSALATIGIGHGNVAARAALRDELDHARTLLPPDGKGSGG